MSCPDHPQWYHDREDCPFCTAIDIRTEQQRRQAVAPASAAWQDVEQVLQQEPDLHVLKILIADAKAADAARIAALEQQLTALPTTAAWQDVANALAEWINRQPPAFGPDGDPTIAPVYTAWTLLTHLIFARAADAQQIERQASEIAHLRQAIALLEKIAAGVKT